MNQPLVLVDGSGYFFRAFHALPPLTTSKQQPTGAIFGVVNMVKKLQADIPTTHFAIIFDAKGPTFRHELYADYKAHRPPLPKELSGQFPFLLKILTAMGVPVVSVAGVEADDVIGTLATQATLDKREVIISTSDKDLAQLVNDHVTLINTMTQQRLDPAGVAAKFGVQPQQIIDYLTLVGDTVDNIKGVPKCGPKTAVKWLNTYGTLANLLAHAHEITGKIGDNLRAAQPLLAQSKQLVTIKTDVALPITLDELVMKKPDNATLISLTHELEFKAWHKELTQTTPAPSKPLTNSTSIDSPKAWEVWLENAHKAAALVFEFHCSKQDELIGLSLMTGPDDLMHINFADTQSLTFAFIAPGLKSLFNLAHMTKISHDLKQSFVWLKKADIAPTGLFMDTMLASYVLNSTAAKHDLASLATAYLQNTADLTYPKSATLPELTQINSARLLAIHALNDILCHKLSPNLMKVLQEIELPLLWILADMEHHGVLIDTHLLKQHKTVLDKRIKTLEDEITQLAGHEFNVNSPKQLQVVLFDEQKLPITARTPKGQPSTAESVLEELAADYPLPSLILTYRRLTKLVSTYVDALPKRINPHTKRIHTCFNQAITATGRLSSSEPNLQNIPIRHEEGRLIRSAFIAPLNHVLISADYSQIELRIMAHLSQDAHLLHAFAHNLDIHRATAAELFDVTLSEVTTEQRRCAKAVNFGLIYGMSAFGLAKQLKIERFKAQHYLERYFARYPGVQDYMDKTRAQAHAQGFVETLMGRRLYLPAIHAKNMALQRAAERMAINAPMQGTAADIIKCAMIHLAKWQKSHPEIDLNMTMQVHDELVFEVAENHVEQAKKIIQHTMEHAATLDVPLIVSIGEGSNWDEAH
ncbi:MAG: DNA polymerase I [Legionellaceae bacterium]|nr:DNA polymerase I [Legionellaceae bacterium]HCA89934.1 DNA polymerase I [Legionellales bacterium]|tara:strand:+ start:4276 stop:6891 length:2616 start_codon:yes stop_codon:yes gene_type:complete